MWKQCTGAKWLNLFFLCVHIIASLDWLVRDNHVCSLVSGMLLKLCKIYFQIISRSRMDFSPNFFKD